MKSTVNAVEKVKGRRIPLHGFEYKCACQDVMTGVINDSLGSYLGSSVDPAERDEFRWKHVE